jgi:hypothetical protein
VHSHNKLRILSDFKALSSHCLPVSDSAPCPIAPTFFPPFSLWFTHPLQCCPCSAPSPYQIFSLPGSAQIPLPAPSPNFSVAYLWPPSSSTPIIFFCFVSFSFFCVSFAALLPPQRYYLPVPCRLFWASSVTLIGCTDPAIFRHRSASCVADLRLHRLHQIASAPIPAQPQQLHQSRRVHVSVSRFNFFFPLSISFVTFTH